MTHSGYKLTIEDCKVGDEVFCASEPIGSIVEISRQSPSIKLNNGFWYFLHTITVPAAERRAAEAKAARPEWVRNLADGIWAVNGAVYRVERWVTGVDRDRPAVVVPGQADTVILSHWEAARPEWVRVKYTQGKAFCRFIPGGTVCRVVSWDDPRSPVVEYHGAHIHIHNEWEPAPAPVAEPFASKDSTIASHTPELCPEHLKVPDFIKDRAQAEPVEQEPFECWVEHKGAQVFKGYPKHQPLIDGTRGLDGTTYRRMIERRAYDVVEAKNLALSHLNDQLVISADAMKAERDKLADDLHVTNNKYAELAGELAAVSDELANHKIAYVGAEAHLKVKKRIAELERELATAKEIALNRAVSVPAAAPKVEPFKLSDFVMSAGLSDVDYLNVKALETISAQLAALAQGGK